MSNERLQRLGVSPESRRYSSDDMADIIAKLFGWIPPCSELALKNTTGRDIFQQSRVDGYCRAFLRYSFFGGAPTELEIWWWLVIRVRLHFALDYFQTQAKQRPDWELIATADELMEFLYSQLTLAWQVEGLRWLLLDRARLPLMPL